VRAGQDDRGGGGSGPIGALARPRPRSGGLFWVIGRKRARYRLDSGDLDQGSAGWWLDRDHDVSNLGGCGLGDGLCLGVSPRAKVSMISIGDRQHGQGFQWRLRAVAIGPRRRYSRFPTAAIGGSGDCPSVQTMRRPQMPGGRGLSC
jgi:hypothetical protein